MGIRVYKPTSAGRRNASVSDFAELTPGAKPEKSLLLPKKKKGGRLTVSFQSDSDLTRILDVLGFRLDS